MVVKMQERGLIISNCLIFRCLQNVNETFSRNSTEKTTKGFRDLIKRMTGLPFAAPVRRLSLLENLAQFSDGVITPYCSSISPTRSL
jgi:hypothetical protein